MVVTDLFGYREVDAGQCTYLAIDYSRGRKLDDVEDYVHEGGYPYKTVNLTDNDCQFLESERDFIATDPYCPTVVATPSNDTPLKVQSSDEFPTEKCVHVTLTSYEYLLKGRQLTGRCHNKHARASLTPLLNTSSLRLGRSKSRARPQKHTHRCRAGPHLVPGNLSSEMKA
jgi:hypothetical protein